MAVFTQTVDVSGAASYPTDPQVTIPFIPKSIAIVLEDTVHDAHVSFDGENDAAHLMPNLPSGALEFSQRVVSVWLKRGTVVGAPTNVQVLAETY